MWYQIDCNASIWKSPNTFYHCTDWSSIWLKLECGRLPLQWIATHTHTHTSMPTILPIGNSLDCQEKEGASWKKMWMRIWKCGHRRCIVSARLTLVRPVCICEANCDCRTEHILLLHAAAVIELWIFGGCVAVASQFVCHEWRCWNLPRVY